MGMCSCVFLLEWLEYSVYIYTEVSMGNFDTLVRFKQHS